MIIKNRKIGCGRPLICVSVTAATEDGIRKQFRDLVYEDIDAVEIFLMHIVMNAE